MYIKLKSAEGKVIETKVGSCWTCVFLSVLGPLIRGDVKFFVLYTLLEGIGLYISLYVNEHIGVPFMACIMLVFESNYNTWFIRGKLKRGWKAETEKDRKVLVEKGIIKLEAAPVDLAKEENKDINIDINIEEMSDIVIEQNRTKTLLRLVAAFPILLLGILATIQIKNSLLYGACGIIILVLLTPTYFRIVRQFFSGGPLLKVNQEGIAGWGKFFAWKKIEKVEIRRDWSATFLTVYMRNNGRIRKYNLNTKDINGSATELIEQISALRSRYT